MCLQAILECYVDDVIRSQNKSKLWTTIALSKFELEKRSTAQNVANWTGYQKFEFQFHIQISKFWQVSNFRLPFHTHCYTSIFATASLTTCVVPMKNALIRAIKISEFGKWVERHNGGHVNHVTSDDVTGDRKVAQPSRVHATKSVALATRWCPSGWVKA